MGSLGVWVLGGESGRQLYSAQEEEEERGRENGGLRPVSTWQSSALYNAGDKSYHLAVTMHKHR